MPDLLSRKILETLHFDKPTLDQNLQLKYENSSYKIYIPFDCLPKFESVAVETLYNGKRKEFRIVSDRKGAEYKDRENVGRFIHLLAAKYKYDVVRGIDPDNAGFLHIDEIDRLREDAHTTKVPSTIYGGLRRLYRNAKDRKSPENRLLLKFLADIDQLFHLVCWCGNVGSGPDDDRRNTLFWLNVSADDIIITDGQKELSNDRLKERLSLLFPGRCFPKKPTVSKQKRTQSGTDEIPDSRITEFRKKLKEIAESHLKEKLYHKELKDYRVLELEIGLTEKSDYENDITVKRYSHHREWKVFDPKQLENPEAVYLLSSETGSGKTTFLRHLQLELINKTKFIPLFLEASDLERGVDFGNSNEENFWGDISRYFNGYLNTGNETEFLKEVRNKIIFLIDGLDQITGSGTEYNHLVDKLMRVVKDKLIITSRPFAAIDKERDSRIKFLRLKSFSEKEVRLYFGKNYNRAKELCQTCPEMIRIPMLAYMVCCIIEEGQDQDIKNRTDLYKRFIDHIFKNQISGKLELSFDDKDEPRDLLGEISYRAIADKNSYLQKIPYKFAKQCLHQRGINSDIKIETLFKVGLPDTIVNESCGNGLFLYFSHQSFQEYLAAEFIKDNDDIIEQVLREKWNPKWKEVIKYLAGLKGEGIITKLLDKKDDLIHSNLFLSAELAQETDISLGIKNNISNQIEKLLDCPLCGKDAERYWVYVNETEAVARFICKTAGKEAKTYHLKTLEAIIEFKDSANNTTQKHIKKLQDFVNKDRMYLLHSFRDLELCCSKSPGPFEQLLGRLYEKGDIDCDPLSYISNRIGNEYTIKQLVGELEDKETEDWSSAFSILDILTKSENNEILDELIKCLISVQNAKAYILLRKLYETGKLCFTEKIYK